MFHKIFLSLSPSLPIKLQFCFRDQRDRRFLRICKYPQVADRSVISRLVIFARQDNLSKSERERCGGESTIISSSQASSSFSSSRDVYFYILIPRHPIFPKLLCILTISLFEETERGFRIKNYGDNLNPPPRVPSILSLILLRSPSASSFLLAGVLSFFFSFFYDTANYTPV